MKIYIKKIIVINKINIYLKLSIKKSNNKNY